MFEFEWPIVPETIEFSVQGAGVVILMFPNLSKNVTINNTVDSAYELYKNVIRADIKPFISNDLVVLRDVNEGVYKYTFKFYRQRADSVVVSSQFSVVNSTLPASGSIVQPRSVVDNPTPSIDGKFNLNYGSTVVLVKGAADITTNVTCTELRAGLTTAGVNTTGCGIAKQISKWEEKGRFQI